MPSTLKKHLVDLRLLQLYGREVTRCGKNWGEKPNPRTKGNVTRDRVEVHPLGSREDYCVHCFKDHKVCMEEGDMSLYDGAIEKFETTGGSSA